MDNLTHTLLGALVAETAARFVPKTKALLPENSRRNLYLTLMVAGSNVPDLDSLYAGITGGKLGYLLHHRGHTHTLIGAVAIALAMYALCAAWLRWRRLPAARADHVWLGLVALLAPLLHIAMDFTNEYGVHPFWPLDNRWFYGDAIFIIEPLFWAAAAPLLFLVRSVVPRVLVGLVLLVGVGLGFGSGLVPLAQAFGLLALTAIMLLVGWRAPAKVAAVAGLVASAGIILLFATTAKMARDRTGNIVAMQYPAARTLDLVLAPMPVNPLCWEVIAVQVEGDAYALRQALLSLAPGWMPANDCPGPGRGVQTTVTLLDSATPDVPAFAWINEVTMSRRAVQALLQDNCEARAFAGFARALWLQESAQGWLVGDLRYDREPGLAFAEMEVAANPAQCPRFVPPWVPPRSDLL